MIKTVVTIILISLGIVCIWFRGGNIMGSGESGLPFYDLNRMVEMSARAWADPGLGGSIGIQTATSPTYLLLAKLQNLGVSGFILQALWSWVCLAVSGIAIAYLTRDFFPNLKSRYYVLAAFIYWFNPISLVNIWNRYLYLHMAFFALFPLITFLFRRAIVTKKYQYPILVAISSAVFSYSLASVAFILVSWMMFLYTTVFYCLGQKRAEVLRNIRIFIITLFSFIFINFWWLIQLFSFVGSSVYESSVSSFFTTQGNVVTLAAMSENLGNFIKTITLSHGTFYHTAPNWARIYLNPIIAIGLLSIPILIFWVVYKLPSSKEKLYLSFLLILTLIFMAGSNPPFGGIFKFFFTELTIIQVFRNPFEKFGFILPIASTPLIVVGIAKILNTFPVSLRVLLKGLYVGVILILWGYPFWSSLAFTRINNGKDASFISYETKVPEDYLQSNHYLRGDGEQNRIVVLPIGGEGIDYSWEKPFSGVESSSALLEKPNISFNTTIPYYYDLVSEVVRNQVSDRLLQFNPLLNARYIVVRNDIDYKARGMADPLQLVQIMDQLAEKQELSKVWQTKYLDIYKVNDKWMWPKVYITSEILYSNAKDISKISTKLNGFPDRRYAIIDTSHEDLVGKINENIIIKPERIYFPHLIHLIAGLSDNDILAKLFHSKHMPGSAVYPLIKWKEQLEKPSSSDYYGEIIYLTGILGKRSSEIYKLKKSNADPTLISSAEKDYLRLLNKLSPTLKSIVKNEDQISLVLRESLLMQHSLLTRVNSSSLAKIEEILVDFDILHLHPISQQNQYIYLVYRFRVPKESDYLLDVLQVNNKYSLYIDGKPIGTTDDSQVSNNLHRLSQGVHEVAVVSEDLAGFNKEVFKLESKLYSEKSTLTSLALPDVPSTYQVEFDYLVKQGQGFEVQFVQDTNKEDGPVMKTQLGGNKITPTWQRWQTQFQTSPGARSGSLIFTNSKVKICPSGKDDGSCIEQILPFDVEVKNLKLSHVIYPDLLLSTQLKNSDVAQNTTKVDWFRKDPTEYHIKISKNTSEKEMLVFSELFNSEWQLYLQESASNWNNTKTLKNWNDNVNEYLYEDNKFILGSFIHGKNFVDAEQHFLVNGYANGWLVEKPGEYNLILKFKPQNYLNIGSIVSLTSLTLSLILLTYLLWRKY